MGELGKQCFKMEADGERFVAGVWGPSEIHRQEGDVAGLLEGCYKRHGGVDVEEHRVS